MRNLVVWAIAASLTGTALAQTAPATSKKPTVKQEAKGDEPVKPASKPPAATRFSMSMLESDRVDQNYAGMPVAEVIAAIEKLTAVKKGEFESTAEFNARRTAALSEKFLGELSIADTFAFVTNVTKGGKYISGLKYDFNADTGDVNLFALPASSEYLPLNGIGAPDYTTNRRESRGLDQFDLGRKIESRSTYQASNAYGATVMVDKTVATQVGLAAKRISFLNFKRDLIYSNPQAAVQFKLANAKAAQELPALKAMIVMKLADPHIVYNFRHVAPKRDAPVDISVQEKFLTGEVIGMVFYSGLSGEIFARLPENFGKPVPRTEDKPVTQ